MKTLEKRCSKCHKIYPATLEYFCKDKKGKNGLRAQCKVCTRKTATARIKNGYKCPGRKKSLQNYNNSEKGAITQLKYGRTEKGKALSRRARLKHYYSATTDDYNYLFNQQNGKCAICGIHQQELKRRLDLDHCHNTKKIRGLLCSGCNRNLGRFENGRNFNPYLTQRFMEYLKYHKSNFRGK